MQAAGKTLIGVASGGHALGLLALADAVRPTSSSAIARLKAAGIDVVMLTGDNAETARAVAASVGITDFRAGVLPQDKAEAVRELKVRGRRHRHGRRRRQRRAGAGRGRRELRHRRRIAISPSKPPT